MSVEFYLREKRETLLSLASAWDLRPYLKRRCHWWIVKPVVGARFQPKDEVHLLPIASDRAFLVVVRPGAEVLLTETLYLGKPDDWNEGDFCYLRGNWGPNLTIFVFRGLDKTNSAGETISTIYIEVFDENGRFLDDMPSKDNKITRARGTGDVIILQDDEGTGEEPPLP